MRAALGSGVKASELQEVRDLLIGAKGQLRDYPEAAGGLTPLSSEAAGEPELPEFDLAAEAALPPSQSRQLS